MEMLGDLRTKQSSAFESLVEGEDEVGLGQFAAICGMTEKEFSAHMFRKLEQGRLLDLLNLDAQADLSEWIIGQFFSGKEFVVVFRLSLNRKRDACLFCVCSVRNADREALVDVRHAIPGLIDNVPKEVLGLESFEVGFCDMKTSCGTGGQNG